MTMEKHQAMKMYLLLNMVIFFRCHVSFQWSNGKKQPPLFKVLQGEQAKVVIESTFYPIPCLPLFRKPNHAMVSTSNSMAGDGTAGLSIEKADKNKTQATWSQSWDGRELFEKNGYQGYN